MSEPYYIEKYINDSINHLYPKNKDLIYYILVTIHIGLPIFLLGLILLLLFLKKKSVLYLIILLGLAVLYWNFFDTCPYNNLMKKLFNIDLPRLPIKINTIKYIGSILLILIIIAYLIRR